MINVIVNTQRRGYYGCKQPESEGVARGQGLFTAIISEATGVNYYITTHLIGPIVFVMSQLFTIMAAIHSWLES